MDYSALYAPITPDGSVPKWVRVFPIGAFEKRQKNPTHQLIGYWTLNPNWSGQEQCEEEAQKETRQMKDMADAHMRRRRAAEYAQKFAFDSQQHNARQEEARKAALPKVASTNNQRAGIQTLDNALLDNIYGAQKPGQQVIPQRMPNFIPSQPATLSSQSKGGPVKAPAAQPQPTLNIARPPGGQTVATSASPNNLYGPGLLRTSVYTPAAPNTKMMVPTAQGAPKYTSQVPAIPPPEYPQDLIGKQIPTHVRSIAVRIVGTNKNNYGMPARTSLQKFPVANVFSKKGELLPASALYDFDGDERLFDKRLWLWLKNANATNMPEWAPKRKLEVVS